MNITFLDNINPVYILLLYSTLSSIIVIYISQYIKDIDKVSFQCIRYLCDFIILILLFLFYLKQEQKEFIFSKNSLQFWKICLPISVGTLICSILYYVSLHKTGPAKTRTISHSFNIIITFFISYYFLKNYNINFKVIIGIIIILIGLRLVIYNSGYM